MALDVWTVSSGYNLGTYNERETIYLPLPATTIPGIRFKIIAGYLPPGLEIIGSSITGTPFEVTRTTEYKFVVRATNGYEISDRTFIVNVQGPNAPNWLTPAGLLPIGSNNAYYIIDSSFIDFNLSASDTDTAAGQSLNFFIASGDGELPPGLILVPNGRITGFIQPLLAVPQNGDNGFYDVGLYDATAYDFGYRPTNGYDSFVYDFVTYDFSVNTLTARKLNRNYEFYVTITDGDTVTKRKFRIYVVGDDFFRADDVIMQAGEGTYTADVTYVRAPIFTTPSYLGLCRANNYQTFKIDIYEGFSELGPVTYELSTANASISGLCLRELHTDNRMLSTSIRYVNSSGIPAIGYKVNFNGEFPGATPITYTVIDVEMLGGNIYRLTIDLPLQIEIPNNTAIFLGTASTIPPGMAFDSTSGEVFGTIPYQPAITERYTFTVKAIRFGREFEFSTSRRLFTVDILGEVESVMNWTSPSSLDNINAGYPSALFVSATTTFSNASILYTLTSGKLPPGLSLNLDGEIVGKVNQIRNQNTYKSYWKSNNRYSKKDIIKTDKIQTIKSIIRRKNIATLVTSTDHAFANNEIVKIASTQLFYNDYTGIKISVDKIKINSVLSITSVNPLRIKFSIPTQKLPPLAPIVTKINGTSARKNYYLTPVEVTASSSSGIGHGARFLINKGSNNTYNYNGLITVILINPGTGYLPGDTITILGSQLPGELPGSAGIDGINDLNFTTENGFEFWFKINGNSNANYNGRFFAIDSTASTITLGFTGSNPGDFGTGLISETIDGGFYEAQTHLTPLNYFNYNNSGKNSIMLRTVGTATGSPRFYQALISHVSSTFIQDQSTNKWKSYAFTEADSILTTIDRNLTTFDSFQATIDRGYTFTVNARDHLGYSAISKTFSIRVDTPNQAYYSNITARPFLKLEQRDIFKQFINDFNIFDPQLVYRLTDSNFGVQREMSTLIYAGIETVDAAAYISAMGVNHRPKRFNLGTIKKAVAKEPGTNTVVYEVIYVDLIDPLEPNNKQLPSRISYRSTDNTYQQVRGTQVTVDNTNEFYLRSSNSDNPYWKRPNPFYASVDRTDVLAGDSGQDVKFPSSISIWRKLLRGIETAQRERNYLPLWMRSIQDLSVEELDYVPAVVLCYCKPGSGDNMLLNIKNHIESTGFDFKLFDFTIDRYVIDSVEGYYEDKYLIFRNDRTTIT